MAGRADPGRSGGKPCDLNIIAGGYAGAALPGADLRLGRGGASRKFRRSGVAGRAAAGRLGQLAARVGGNGGNAWVSRGPLAWVGMASLECRAKSEADQGFGGIVREPLRLIAAAAWGGPVAIPAEAPPGPPIAPRPVPSTLALPFFPKTIELCSIAENDGQGKSQSFSGPNGSGSGILPACGSADRQKRTHGHDGVVARGRGHGMSVETCGLAAKPVTLWGGPGHVN